ncbi:MAG: hypothetical protein IPJ76_01655 [Flavobacteriales bacterium]|nr:MAG: hypothetical protein IPJ76_01655 [Flavobacteriales bacterium]
MDSDPSARNGHPSPKTAELPPIVEHSKRQFDELQRLVHALTAEQYRKPAAVLSNANIGQHMRHVLEFYLCILNAEHNTVDYDARKRDKALETDRVAVLGTLDALKAWMESLSDDADMSMMVDHSTDGSGSTRMRTSLFRELAYAFDHGIHHLALLRIAVEQEHRTVQLHPDFGVAPSTIRDRRKQNA